MEGHASISNGIVVVLDIGSSSIRVAAFKPSPDRGSAPVLIDGSLAAMPCTLNDAGEGDSLETKRCLEACIDFCLVGLRQNYQLRTSASEESPPLKVAAVCCASYAMSWLGVNSTTGHPCTPVFTYARADPGAPAAVEALRARVGSSDKRALRRLYAETGVPLHAAYAPALLYQLTAASCSNGGSGGSSSHVDSPASGVAANTVWQTIGAWVLAQWCGLASIPLSTSEASWTGLLHVHKCEWHTELATFLGLVLPPLPRTGLSDTPSLRAATNITNTSKADPASNTPNPYAGHLPPVVDYAATNLGLALAPAWAARWPELAHARLLLPVGDGACANVGTGCVDATKLACTVGTSAAVRVVLPVPPPLPLGPPLGLWCYRIDCKRVRLVTDTKASVLHSLVFIQFLLSMYIAGECL
jgi:gluconokinase